MTLRVKLILGAIGLAVAALTIEVVIAWYSEPAFYKIATAPKAAFSIYRELAARLTPERREYYERIHQTFVENGCSLSHPYYEHLKALTNEYLANSTERLLEAMSVVERTETCQCESPYEDAKQSKFRQYTSCFCVEERQAGIYPEFAGCSAVLKTHYGYNVFLDLEFTVEDETVSVPRTDAMVDTKGIRHTPGQAFQ
jgi:hypothetical protein